MANFKEEVAQIKAFVFDVDGVFTDCRISISQDGEFLRQFNVRDGLAVVRAVEKGYPIAIISGGKGIQLEQRMKGLGIEHIYLGKSQKMDSLMDFANKCNIQLSDIVYMGDDYPDLAPMSSVRLGVAPSDAADDVKAAAHYISGFKGGYGCVRDIIEQVLRARGDWFNCISADAKGVF